MKTTNYLSVLAVATGLAGCTLTQELVEPALPQGRLNESSTAVFRANGEPVVANNSTNIGTILVGFLGDPRPVTGKLDRDSTLVVFARDQNAGPASHRLTLALPKFKGPGTYKLSAAWPSQYAELANAQNAAGGYDELTFRVLSSEPAEFIVTSWAPATRRLVGTFRLTVANGVQRIAITEGAADIDVDK
ncbi:hypothetical protein GCM10027422_30130 [Hymenobacter arcticus]